MNDLLEGSEKLERELTPEPMAAPAVGSLLLHGGLAAVLLVYGILGGLLHHNFWGNPGVGGAIQVNLVSSALPLPSDQPPNQNVLATETPSKAPAEPAPSVMKTRMRTSSARAPMTALPAITAASGGPRSLTTRRRSFPSKAPIRMLLAPPATPSKSQLATTWYSFTNPRRLPARPAMAQQFPRPGIALP